MLYFLPPLLLPEHIRREGNNLVYWTPQRTGSSSIRAWLWAVAAVLRIDTAASFSFMNNTDEDDHRMRHTRLGVPRCSFLTGHINARNVNERDNELKLGAVITTIRDPAALLTSRYFYRGGNRFSKKALDGYSDSKSRVSRLWFFYWNDRDPCEQLRYYDGLPGCAMKSITGLQRRARSIAERIDCVIDTDNPRKDLAALCRRMTLDDEECPTYRRRRRRRKGDREEMYEKLLNFSHIREAVSRHLMVASMLRDELAKRKCRFLDDDSEIELRTPRADAPQWPTKMCSNVTSSLEDDREDDSPENNAADDDDMFAGEVEGMSDTEDNVSVGTGNDDVDDQ